MRTKTQCIWGVCVILALIVLFIYALNPKLIENVIKNQEKSTQNNTYDTITNTKTQQPQYDNINNDWLCDFTETKENSEITTKQDTISEPYSEPYSNTESTTEQDNESSDDDPPLYTKEQIDHFKHILIGKWKHGNATMELFENGRYYSTNYVEWGEDWDLDCHSEGIAFLIGWYEEGYGPEVGAPCRITDITQNHFVLEFWDGTNREYWYRVY